MNAAERRSCQHPLDLGRRTSGSCKLAGRRQVEQLLIRHRGPEKIRQPRGQRIRRQSLVAGLVEVQEAGRAQHGASSRRGRPPAAIGRTADATAINLHQAVDFLRFAPGGGTPARRTRSSAAASAPRRAAGRSATASQSSPSTARCARRRPRLMERAFDLHFVDVDLRELAVLDGVEPMLDDPASHRPRETDRHTFRTMRPHMFARRPSCRCGNVNRGVKPASSQTRTVYHSRLVRQVHLRQQRLDRLRLVQRPAPASSPRRCPAAAARRDRSRRIRGSYGCRRLTRLGLEADLVNSRRRGRLP